MSNLTRLFVNSVLERAELLPRSTENGRPVIDSEEEVEVQGVNRNAPSVRLKYYSRRTRCRSLYGGFLTFSAGDRIVVRCPRQRTPLLPLGAKVVSGYRANHYNICLTMPPPPPPEIGIPGVTASALLSPPPCSSVLPLLCSSLSSRVPLLPPPLYLHLLFLLTPFPPLLPFPLQLQSPARLSLGPPDKLSVLADPLAPAHPPPTHG
ncbi:hypothetical protein NLJ89_g8500 [Agrocybe chaxingu]|uniref:Uncharacterized protein n=1 Tax=Agrocybe chaxingu TaxID=84603 RepID=A0A9W8MU12_9AGAR|nr:hypothetical protein NLJ89_g8500 [Agrocybe chaxingu]